MQMKRDLKSIANQTAKSVPSGSAADSEQAQSIEDVAKRYQNKNQNELMQELMKNISKQKAEGNFNPEQLETFFKSATPLLTPEQRGNMRKLIDQIKKS